MSLRRTLDKEVESSYCWRYACAPLCRNQPINMSQKPPTHSPNVSICSFVGIAKDFFVPCAANGAVCSVLMGHQQITLWHLPHTISIFELSATNSISSKLGLPESQLHSLTHSNFFYLLLLTNLKYNNMGSFYLNHYCLYTNIEEESEND